MSWKIQYFFTLEYIFNLLFSEGNDVLIHLRRFIIKSLQIGVHFEIRIGGILIPCNNDFPASILCELLYVLAKHILCACIG